MITLYTTGCPRCAVLKKKLDEAHIAYSTVDDLDVLLGKGIASVPVLEVDGNLLDFGESLRFIESRKGEETG